MRNKFSLLPICFNLLAFPALANPTEPTQDTSKSPLESSSNMGRSPIETLHRDELLIIQSYLDSASKLSLASSCRTLQSRLTSPTHSIIQAFLNKDKSAFLRIVDQEITKNPNWLFKRVFKTGTVFNRLSLRRYAQRMQQALDNKDYDLLTDTEKEKISRERFFLISEISDYITFEIHKRQIQVEGHIGGSVISLSGVSIPTWVKSQFQCCLEDKSDLSKLIKTYIHYPAEKAKNLPFSGLNDSKWLSKIGTSTLIKIRIISSIIDSETDFNDNQRYIGEETPIDMAVTLGSEFALSLSERYVTKLKQLNSNPEEQRHLTDKLVNFILSSTIQSTFIIAKLPEEPALEFLTRLINENLISISTDRSQETFIDKTNKDGVIEKFLLERGSRPRLSSEELNELRKQSGQAQCPIQ